MGSSTHQLRRGDHLQHLAQGPFLLLNPAGRAALIDREWPAADGHADAVAVRETPAGSVPAPVPEIPSPPDALDSIECLGEQGQEVLLPPTHDGPSIPAPRWSRPRGAAGEAQIRHVTLGAAAIIGEIWDVVVGRAATHPRRRSGRSPSPTASGDRGRFHLRNRSRAPAVPRCSVTPTCRCARAAGEVAGATT